MTASGEWQPAQYARFGDERTQPFFDLAAMVARRPGMRVVDLGSGTGRLTAWLHRELEAGSTLGVDRSPAMLAEAEAHRGDGVRFEARDIRDFVAETPAASFDLVWSNAALQWVDDHATLFPRVAALVAPGGQIAIQMPANDDHPSHDTAREVARSFAAELGGWVRPDPVQPPEWYAGLLHDLGFVDQRVQLVVYPHVLEETRAVVEWVKGSLLTAYRERLPGDRYAAFVEEYERRLLERLGDRRPYLYPFKRVLMRAMRTF